MQNVFYHYTAIQGALGILTSRTVWLTDYRFLNDRNELTKAIADFSKRLDGETRIAFDWGFTWHHYSAHQCLLSLSESPQILSQWRSYADDARGFAIGFDESYLRSSGASIVRCIYENHDDYIEAIAERHEPALRKIVEIRRELHATLDKRQSKLAFRSWIFSQPRLFDLIVHDLIALKNPAFVEEREVRVVVSVPRGRALIRASNSLMIPYTSLPFATSASSETVARLAVPEVWLGPKCNALNAKTLDAMDLGTCRVRKYDCGYV